VSRKILIVALGMAGLTLAGAAQAFNFGNMMNPSRWFGNDDYDRGYYRHGPYGGYGPWGYGGPYGPYGWGGPWGGYPGGYGYGGGSPSTIVVAPQSGESKAPPPRTPE
jgi:hypothetical protein